MKTDWAMNDKEVKNTKQITFNDGGGITQASPTTSTIANTADYHKCVFLASSSAATSIANNSDTLITFNTEYDPGGYFDLANEKFVAPVNGFYQFSAMVALVSTAWTAGEIMQLELYVDGAAAYSGARYTCEANVTTVVSNNLSVGLYLTANQEVKLYCFQNSGAAVNTVAASRYCYFSGGLMYRA